MKKILSAVMALVALAGLVYAAAPGSAGGKKAQLVPVDGNGRAWADKRPVHVWEILNSASASQVLDNDSSQPKTGILIKMCVSSGTATSEYAVAFDSNTTSGLSITTTGKRLMAPLHRATTSERCSDELNVEFTSGLVGLNSAATGGTYIYWKPNGGSN